MNRARRLILNLGAVLGAVCVVAALAATLFDVRPMVFRSGSMAPTIDTGALALVHRVDATALAEGDVVTVPTEAGTLVTHRIVELTRAGDSATLRLRGDANEATDQQAYYVTEADRVVASVPKVGYAVGWLTGPLGRFALGLYAAFLVMILLKPGSGANGRPRAHTSVPGRHRVPKPRARIRTVTTAAMVVLLGAVGIARATPGWAAWADSVDVSGVAFAAHEVILPESVDCSGGGLLASLTYTWADTDLRYSYRVELVNPNGSVRQTNSIPETGAANYSITYAASDLPSGNFTVRVKSYLTSTPTWMSSTTRDSSGSKLGIGSLATTSCPPP